MFDFLKTFYQKKIDNPEDDIQRMGYQFAKVARNNSEVRSYLDMLCAQYDADPRELDIRFASYLMVQEFPELADKISKVTGLEHNETRVDLARQKGISENLILRAENDPIAKALMLSHLRLAITGGPLRDTSEVEASFNQLVNSKKYERELSQEIVILDEREDSTMVSHWKVYLCAIKESDGLTLCQLQRAALGSVDDYLEYDDNGEALNELPELIEGKDVYGVEDSMILGYELADYGQYERITIAYDETFKESISAFLSQNRWDETNLERIIKDYSPNTLEVPQAVTGLSKAEMFLKSLPENISGLTNRRSELKYYPDPVSSVSIAYTGNNVCTVYAWEGGPELDGSQKFYSLADRVIEEVRNGAIALAQLGFPINEKSEMRPLDPGDGEWFAAVLYFDTKEGSDVEQLCIISNSEFSIKIRGASQTSEVATEFTQHLTAWFMKLNEEGRI